MRTSIVLRALPWPIKTLDFNIVLFLLRRSTETVLSFQFSNFLTCHSLDYYYPDYNYDAQYNKGTNGFRDSHTQVNDVG